MASTSSTISLVPSRRSRPSTPENGLSENFYHEKLDREGAEEVSSIFDDSFFYDCQVLRDGGFTEGLFLVRQSASVKGDFVLSVVVKVDHHFISIHSRLKRYSLSSPK